MFSALDRASDALSRLAPDVLASLDSATRLLSLSLQDASASEASLQVEACLSAEGVSCLSRFDLFLLSPEPDLPLASLLGRQAELQIRTADGALSPRSGFVGEAERLDADGALARYRLRLVPWLWLATQRSDCRVFQEKSVREIVDAVFAAYAPYADWAWAPECETFLADAPRRSYCVQYRETDYAFVTRLLAEEGLGFSFAEREAAADEPLGTTSRHTLQLFASSADLPEDASSAQEGGVRFHRADATEASDAITALGTRLQLRASITQLASWAYKTGQVVAGGEESPAALATGGDSALLLEDYDTPGAYAFASEAALARAARLLREATETRNEQRPGAGSVRSFRPGTRFHLRNGPLEFARDPETDEAPGLLLLGVRSLSLNNLPRDGGQARAVAAVRHWLDASQDAASGIAHDAGDVLPSMDFPLLADAATRRGHANVFLAQRAERPWRPALLDGTGLRLNPRPTAAGTQSAIVVGPQGEASGGSAGDVHTDALHRVRVRFHWQRADEDCAPHTAWLRVSSRAAGGGLGMQFVPRIGQEVLVGFLEGDIDRPIVLGALYNGRGEGAQSPSPGGADGEPVDTGIFGQARDHGPSAQGNLAGGHSPAWHGEGAAQGEHRHRAALSGFKSAALGQSNASPNEYNQLVFDDTDAQLRVQLASTHGASQLNLGHLVHQADNYRGSHRGDGFELRTDAYGAVRATRGLLFSTWPAAGSIDRANAEPAGDAAPVQALLKQARAIAEGFSTTAQTHLGTPLAAHAGGVRASQSTLDQERAAIAAQLNSASGMVAPAYDAALDDAAQRNTATSGRRIPHSTDPLITFTGRAGLGLVAGQGQQWASGDTLTWISGADTQLSTGGALRLHTRQSLGIVSGASGKGNLNVHAAHGSVTLQAQSDAADVAARGNVKLASVNATLTAAASKRIHLATAGGAAITIEGGNITVQCPGTLTVHAAKKSFAGGGRVNPSLPQFPKSICVACMMKAMESGSPFARQGG